MVNKLNIKYNVVDELIHARIYLFNHVEKTIPISIARIIHLFSVTTLKTHDSLLTTYD